MMPMGQNGPPPPAPKFVSRLGSVVRGRITKPVLTLCYGPEKIGKSSFAAGAPNVIFLGSEDGTAQLDVARYPQARSWEDLLFAVDDLLQSPHDYQSVAVDTADWFDPYCHDYVCRMNGWANIEAPGFGKGLSAANEEWRALLRKFEVLRERRKMNVILLAHTQVKTFKNPNGEDYDRYELKMTAKTAGLLKEWVDDCLFTNYETHVIEEKSKRGGKKTRAVSDGARYLFTERSVSFDAGNRHSLPEKMPLSWDEYYTAVKRHQTRTPEEFALEIARMLDAARAQKTDEEGKAFVALVEETMKKPNIAGNAEGLAKVANRVSAKIATWGIQVDPAQQPAAAAPPTEKVADAKTTDTKTQTQETKGAST